MPANPSTEARRAPSRVKLRFPERQALKGALAMESPGLETLVVNEKRLFISVDVPAEPLSDGSRRSGSPLTAGASVRSLAREFGAEIVEDVQYQLEDVPEVLKFTVETGSDPTLSDVLAMIRADQVHARATGEGVSLAIVDTGVDGQHGEFPASRRKGGWATIGEDPWTDWNGHGTMCMTIAGASKTPGRSFVGVAPGCGLYACRTHFYDSELAAIYDYLTTRAAAGERIVASNSFGMKTGTPPTPDPNSDFLPALDDAIRAGVFVAFSAGNYHQLAGGTPGGCSPTSIWLHKCRSDVMTVATCDLDRAMWYYSSRGKGQHVGDPGTNSKPDVTAPTPRNGKILYGASEHVLADGWGTSGACPQVAGLAALLWQLSPDMTAADLRNAIVNSSVDLGFVKECQGAGLIDCNAAAAATLST